MEIKENKIKQYPVEVKQYVLNLKNHTLKLPVR